MRRDLDNDILKKLNNDESVRSFESAELGFTCDDEKYHQQKKPIQSLKAVFKQVSAQRSINVS